MWIGDCAEIVRSARRSSVPCGAAPVIVAENRQPLATGPGAVIDLACDEDLIPDVQDMAARLPDELAALEKAFGTPRSRS